MKKRIIFGFIALGILLGVLFSPWYVLAIFLGVLSVVGVAELFKMIKNKFIAALVSFIVVALTSTAVLIRIMNYGNWYIWLAFSASVVTDTFAYTFGMMFGQHGKHRLAPQISPKKTWEGAIGGTFMNIVSYALFGGIAMLCRFEVSWIPLFSLAIIASIMAQFGDLAFSVIKRMSGAKDYGNFLPGHGGILDRGDSLIFAAPTVWLFLQFFVILR